MPLSHLNTDRKRPLALFARPLSPLAVAPLYVSQHLKQRTAHALKKVAVLRDDLDRTEAAVVGGKKKRDSDVAEREGQLRHSQEEIRRLESEVPLSSGGLRLMRGGIEKKNLKEGGPMDTEGNTQHWVRSAVSLKTTIAS